MGSQQLSRFIAPKPGEKPFCTDSSRKTQLKKSTTACLECRKKRQKCDGTSPCNYCRISGAECVIDKEGDGRRKILLKRKLESLEQDNKLLLEVFTTLREADDERALDFFGFLRSNVSLEDISSHLRTSPHSSCPLGETPATVDIYPEDSQGNIHRVMDVSQLIDNPYLRAPARPWTSVTEDDGFVSHLISLYFTWAHPISNWIDRDLFIEDMQCGRIGSHFCSPLLVNAVLAEACFYSSNPEALATPGDTLSRGMHFYNEALKILETERLCLTTYQAYGSIYLVTCTIGRDRLASQFLSQMADNSREVFAKRDQFTAAAGEQSIEMQRAIDNTIYGLFGAMITSTFGLQKLRIAEIPTPILEPLPQTHCPQDRWIPYPTTSAPVLVHTNCVTNSVFDLHTIQSEITEYFFENRGAGAVYELARVANCFHTRLKLWAKRIPACISLRETTTPAILDMHMRYHTAVIVTFGLIRGHPAAGQSLPSVADHAKRQCISAARSIHTLLNLQVSRWPIEHIHLNCVQWAMSALLILLEDMSDSESSNAFSNTHAILKRMARRSQLAQESLQVLQSHAKTLEITFLPEIEV
ncbi:hypothetical protein BJX70DRAFT_405562 [Aspergillus crustosus]